MYNYLNHYRERVVVFHYAGPATSKQLMVEEQRMNIPPLSNFLATLPNLHLIFFNGCAAGKELKVQIQKQQKGHKELLLKIGLKIRIIYKLFIIIFPIGFMIFRRPNII